MSCDIVIAAEGTTFAITPAKLGVPYDIKGTLSFMQFSSLPVIKEMLFTAQPMPADRALRVGLINQVVPPERLDSATTELAGYMIRIHLWGSRYCKSSCVSSAKRTRVTPKDFNELRQYSAGLLQQRLSGGYPGFFERRAPQFQGR